MLVSAFRYLTATGKGKDLYFKSNQLKSNSLSLWKFMCGAIKEIHVLNKFLVMMEIRLKKKMHWNPLSVRK
jgi:hypothetical protein